MTTLAQINNATAFCRYVEATLGWVPPDHLAPVYLRYRREASKVLQKQQENPELYSWKNLGLAVALLAHQKKTRSPVGVFAWVPRALELAAEPEADLEGQIREAMTIEAAAGDPNGWVARLARAAGPYRQQVLDEWKATRR